MHRLSHAALALLVSAGALAAQGTISSQGFGYPVGGLSGAASAMAGANAELDPNSAVNPAAITRTNRFSLMLRLEPESKSTIAGGNEATARIFRFPGFQATGAFGRFVGAIGVSAMLDRTWRNQVDDTLIVSGIPVPSRLQVGSEGAMGDARVALGFIVNPRLQVGASLHAITGENRTVFTRRFDDTTGVQSIGQVNSFGYNGMAYSVGVVAEPLTDFIVAASARFGQELTVELERNELSQATVPGRYGLGLTYFGIPGLSLHGRVDHVRWSDMEGLGTNSVSTFDGTEFSFGAEALGPRMLGANSAIRAGLRSRTLPFGANGNEVKESGFAFGFGIPVSRGRGQMDIGAQRLRRTTSGARENAWLISIGFGIRP